VNFSLIFTLDNFSAGGYFLNNKLPALIVVLSFVLADRIIELIKKF